MAAPPWVHSAPLRGADALAKLEGASEVEWSKVSVEGLIDELLVGAEEMVLRRVLGAASQRGKEKSVCRETRQAHATQLTTNAKPKSTHDTLEAVYP